MKEKKEKQKKKKTKNQHIYSLACPNALFPFSCSVTNLQRQLKSSDTRVLKKKRCCMQFKYQAKDILN